MAPWSAATLFLQRDKSKHQKKANERHSPTRECTGGTAKEGEGARGAYELESAEGGTSQDIKGRKGSERGKLTD
jgi:hypothetical protein